MAVARGGSRAAAVVGLVVVLAVLQVWGSTPDARANTGLSLGGPNAWIVTELASQGYGAATKPSGIATGVGDVPYFGTATYPQGGSRDANPPRLVSGAGKASKLGRMATVSGALALGAQVILPWVWNGGGKNASPTYADAAPLPAGAYARPPSTWNRLPEGAVRYVTFNATAHNWYQGGADTALQTWQVCRSTSGSVYGGTNGYLPTAAYQKPAEYSLSCYGSNEVLIEAGVIAAEQWRLHQASGGTYANVPDSAFAVRWRYQPQTAPAAPAGTNVITTRTTSRCSDGSSASSSITYTGSTPSADLPPITVPACPPGTSRTGVEQTSTAPGVQSLPSPLGNWSPTVVPPAYPDCVSSRCLVELRRVYQDGSLQVCNQTTFCTGWQTAAVAGPVTGTRTVVGLDGATVTEPRRAFPDGSTLECYYGPYAVTIRECSTVPTEVADPQTPTPERQMPGDPLVETPAAPSDSAGGGGDCWPSGWGVFNPLSWVYMPVTCAFRWAATPDVPALQAQLDGVRGIYSGVPPFSWAGGLGAGFGQLIPPLGGIGTCPQWIVNVGGWSANVVCDSSFTAALRFMRPVLAIGMIAVAVQPLLRSLFYASFPLLKPVPTSGGD